MKIVEPTAPRRRVAVIGSGIAGMSAAWLLDKTCDVTVYEAEAQPGGHSCTVDVGGVPVDMGFIVYNTATYPNLCALFDHLRVETRATCMSLGVSLDDGALEYGSRGLAGFLAQPRNLISPRFWSMLADLVRFYRSAPADLALLGDKLTLGEYLTLNGYGEAFRDDHLLPEAAAIWSVPVGMAADYPARAFIRFFENHGLLKLWARPQWRTVVGGARVYADRLTAPFRHRIRTDTAATRVLRGVDGVRVRDGAGVFEAFDEVVLAVHPDQALQLLDCPTPAEARLLGAIRYGANRVVLHRDPALMPRRRAVWSSWNYLGRRRSSAPCSVSYWMNYLQGLPGPDLFVSLNPAREPAPGTVIETRQFQHPIFDPDALAAQSRLGSLQGVQHTWYCGAWFGAGFHEDGLQAGLWVAEAIGGTKRPWKVDNASGRIGMLA